VAIAHAPSVKQQAVPLDHSRPVRIAVAPVVLFELPWTPQEKPVVQGVVAMGRTRSWFEAARHTATMRKVH
jgi:hypothetical protein